MMESILKPAQLKRARESLSISPSEAAAELGITSEVLEAWEAGSIEPDIDTLEALASVYGRSVDYFLSDFGPPPRRISFRTVSRRFPSEREDRRVVASFEELCRFEWELEQLLGIDHVTQISGQVSRLGPTDLAKFERHRSGLGSKPIKDLRQWLNAQGVRVFWLEIPGNEFAGLSWWHEKYGPCILANLKDPPGRRNFTMAHELGHLLADTPGTVTVCDLSDIAAERLANQFASEFLMPEDDLRRYWRSVSDQTAGGIDHGVLAGVARRYAVSVEALSIRVQELGILPNATSLIDKASRQRTFGKGRAKWRRERGEHFFAMALRAHAGYRLSTGKLAELLGTDIGTARRLAVAADS